ncbi:hypothetical protein QBC44DRAFT_79289 [Cladorrhinum sp. PSN332]|nr:hypothetical protein QBC44DRAFT_79289 [Cladorrhinum sp. PSN332]
MTPLTNLILSSLTTIFLFTTPTTANTEKAIFLAPPEINIPLVHPTLTDLPLDILTPHNTSTSAIRTKLTASFPSSSQPKGTSTWLILDKLTPSQRYEVRICWAATQPTSFTLTTYPLSEVFDTPDLITSLNTYSLTRLSQSSAPLSQPPPQTQKGERQTSLLLLHIQSAADYFASNATLMTNVPPVDVDIILDPFLLNVLPRSLAPTVIYIIIVASASLFLSSKIASWVQGLATSTSTEDNEKKQQ